LVKIEIAKYVSLLKMMTSTDLNSGVLPSLKWILCDSNTIWIYSS